MTSKIAKGEDVDLIIIDPQNDFMGNIDGTPHTVRLDTGHYRIADLPVPGAINDMLRLARFIDLNRERLKNIHVTLDSHVIMDVGHGPMWVDRQGNRPKKFTQISAEDIVNGVFATRDFTHCNRMLKYARQLESIPGNYKITVWSDIGHCIIGTWGHNVFPELNFALERWSMAAQTSVNYVLKGMNPWSEHYGALKAEVPDPLDPTTQVNEKFLEQVRPANKIIFAGEALSHCLMRSVEQFAEHLGEDRVKDFFLLRDCTSSIPAIPGVVDFPAIAEAWLEKMEKRGMTVTDSLSLFYKHF